MQKKERKKKPSLRIYICNKKKILVFIFFHLIINNSTVVYTTDGAKSHQNVALRCLLYLLVYKTFKIFILLH